MTKNFIQTMPSCFGLILFLLATISNKSLAQITAIPDPVFEQKLINLGIDSDGQINGQILNSDAAIVSVLSFDQDNIYSLEGIDAFVNLDTIVIKHMPSLDSIILTNKTSLKSISCHSNTSLIYANFSNNTALSMAYCNNNNALVNLDISSNLMLKNLYCSDNKFLVDADFSDNLSLVDLTCVRNDSLTNMNISNDTALVTLHCFVNRLSSLDVSANIRLVELRCDHNYILGNIDVSNNTNLETLFVAHNGMTAIDISNNTALKVFNGSENPINTLDVSNNVALEYLALAFCDLTSLDVSANVNLNLLACEINQLRSLDVSNNTLLEWLSCETNQLKNLDVSNTILLKRLTCRNNQLLSLDLGNHLVLDYLDCGQNQLSRLVLPHANISNVQCMDNARFLSICVPDSAAAAAQDAYVGAGSWYKDPWAVFSENCFPLAVKGRVTIDNNVNCISDSLEVGFANQLIKFEKGNNSLYFSTIDSLGSYTAYLDTGTYTVTVIPPNNYWPVCPSTQQIYIDTNYTIQTLNWSLQALISCPILNVDIAAPFLRMTGGGSSYTVAYCNEGTISATNVYVEVDLDPDLNFISSTVPLASQIGTIYAFNIGNVGVGQCGNFDLQVTLDTSVIIGQTHCTEAHIGAAIELLYC